MGEKPKVADPTISVVMPTRNSQKTIGESLRTLDEQIYPKEKIELIVVDAYSRDGTLQVARTFGAKVLTNPFVTGEAGKSIGVKVAKGDLILFMDSDNLLISPNWLRAMLNPLMQNPRVIASEALYYHYNRHDPAIVRLGALVGADDPLMVYLGFYGRFSVLTGRWSDVDIIPIDHGQYLVHGLPVGRMPTMGANGFLIRSNVLKSWLGDRRYLFDVDLMQELAATSSTVLVARVKVSVTHLYAHSMGQYLRKTFRRIRDYYYFNKSHPRAYAWTSIGNERLGSVILRVLFAFPLIIDSVRSYRKQADPAWFLIWPLCFMSIMVYGVKELSSGFYFLRLRQGSRKPLGHENPRDRSSAESPSKESLSGVR